MSEKTKTRSKGFGVLGVPVGATLTFRKTPAITCKTVDDKNKVEYQGKIYPISRLAKELMKTSISGYHAFKYNGVLLAKLDKKTVPEVNMNTSTIVTSQATEQPQSMVQQAMPLPNISESPVPTQETDDPLLAGKPLA